MSQPVDVHAYYRRITDVNIAEIARELLAGRITQDTGATLYCDCPNHRSQSHRSLQISTDKQSWYCFGCGAGGDVLQLVEFVQSGTVTRQGFDVDGYEIKARLDFAAAAIDYRGLQQNTGK